MTPLPLQFTLTITIEAPSWLDAEALRDEIVGAVEDNHESGAIPATALVGDLEERTMTR